MNSSEPPTLRVQKVGPHDLAQARTLAGNGPQATSRGRRGEPAGGLWAAYRGEALVGVMRAAVQPGKTALVGVPRLADGEPVQTAAELCRRVVEQLPEAGVQLAQALLEAADGAEAAVLRAGGLRHVSDLLYLVSAAEGFPQTPPAGLEFVAYLPALHARLAAVVERTYQDSLDCRAVEGVRSVEDVLRGYREADALDAAQWYMVRRGGADVGCLLISGDAAGRSWELTYLGVVREARRRGVGLAIVRQAQWLARRGRQGKLVLAVDAENVPARRVYAAAGFEHWASRAVFLRVFEPRARV